jgi:F0F1-type ATP synthase delta subunit
LANNFDITKILSLITEDEDPEVVERLAKKLVERYPQKAAMLISRLSLEKEFGDHYITITSARELTAKQKSLIEGILEKQTGHKPTLTYMVNEDLLGGVIIRRGEAIIDNTLRSRINGLVEYIKQTKFTAEVENGKQ